MILADSFFFCHTPRTAGTWLSSVLRGGFTKKLGIQKTSLHEHASLEAVHRLGVTNKRGFGFIRDPYTWYPSVYFFYHKHYFGRSGGYAQPMGQWTELEVQWADVLEKVGKHKEAFLDVAASMVRGDLVPRCQLTGVLDRMYGTAWHKEALLFRLYPYEAIPWSAVKALQWCGVNDLEVLRRVASASKAVMNSSEAPFFGKFAEQEVNAHDSKVVRWYER